MLAFASIGLAGIVYGTQATWGIEAVHSIVQEVQSTYQ